MFKISIHSILISILLILGVWTIYKTVSPNPTPRYDHYLYLAQSFLQSRVDVPQIPDWYHDTVLFNGKKFLPFPPAPAALIIPFIKIWPEITQQQISIFLGAVNAGLIFWLAKRFTNQKTASIVAVFASFGTVVFWASVVGTTWYLAHTVAMTFLILSLLSHFSKKPFLAGLFFALAVLCRYPIALGIIFYLLEYRKDINKLIYFLAGAFIFIPIHFGYNFLRFGSLNEMGYLNLYNMYTSQNYPYSFLRVINPNGPHFGYMDPRNIPLHIISFLILPPLISETFKIYPSPFGMGLLFISPLLLLILIPNWKDKLQRNLWIGAFAIFFAESLHYAQGWVQFGYRFMIDFLPFLLILLAIKFKFNKLWISLLIISILASFWGVGWALKLGW
jgi:hypothetical protein